MSPTLEERIAELAATLDAESTRRVHDDRSTTRATTRSPQRGRLVAAAVVTVLVLALTTWLLWGRGGHGASVRTPPAADAPTTTTSGAADLSTVVLSPAEQVDWLTRQHEPDESVHLPGWRIELDAEAVECDFTGVSGAGAQKISGSASNFPLGEAITADRIIQECAGGTDATRSTGIDLSGQGRLCEVDGPMPLPTGTVEVIRPVVASPVGPVRRAATGHRPLASSRASSSSGAPRSSSARCHARVPPPPRRGSGSTARSRRFPITGPSPSVNRGRVHSHRSTG
jgi:hypothetical protein